MNHLYINYNCPRNGTCTYQTDDSPRGEAGTILDMAMKLQAKGCTVGTITVHAVLKSRRSAKRPLAAWSSPKGTKFGT